MVARLHADFPAVTVSQMDANHLVFPNAHFDIVTAGYLIDMLDNPAAARAYKSSTSSRA